MLAANQKYFIKLFNGLEDPSEDERISYPLNEILLLVVASVLSGAESGEALLDTGIKRLICCANFRLMSTERPLAIRL
jgi:hypothetical protein